MVYAIHYRPRLCIPTRAKTLLGNVLFHWGRDLSRVRLTRTNASTRSPKMSVTEQPHAAVGSAPVFHPDGANSKCLLPVTASAFT